MMINGMLFGGFVVVFFKNILRIIGAKILLTNYPSIKNTFEFGIWILLIFRAITIQLKTLN